MKATPVSGFTNTSVRPPAHVGKTRTNSFWGLFLLNGEYLRAIVTSECQTLTRRTALIASIQRAIGFREKR